MGSKIEQKGATENNREQPRVTSESKREQTESKQRATESNREHERAKKSNV